MHHKISKIKQIEIGQLWHLAQKNQTSIITSTYLDPTKVNHPFFLKAQVKKNNKKHQKSHSTFALKNVLWSKKQNKQHTCTVNCKLFFIQTKRTATKFYQLEKKRRKIRTVWVNSTGYLLQLCKNRYIQIKFAAFSASKLFPMLDHTTSYIEKIHHFDVELAGHVHKLDVKLRSLYGSGFSLFSLRILAKPYHFGVNWPTILCEYEDGVHFFSLTFECHNKYNKLLLCSNSANDGIAWCTKNNWEWGLRFFKEQRLVSFIKKTENTD